jgi:hypothetical protein
VRVFAFLVLIAGLSVGPAKAQKSLTVFAAADKFCEKARLGMEPIAAYDRAVDYVMGNRFFDPDYTLPNWNRAVSSEMSRRCPNEYKKLIKAFQTRAKTAAAEVAAKAAEKARWDALPEAAKAAHREKEEIKQRKIKANIEALLVQEKAKARDDYCARECDHCLRNLSKRRSWCSSYVSDYPYQVHRYIPDRFSCSCD